MSELLVIVPSRGRPQSVGRVVRSWRETGAYEHADLVFVIDADDPEHEAYWDHVPHDDSVREMCSVRFATFERWLPLVPKLNRAALAAAGGSPAFAHRAIAFMGDDHLPRTPGWAAAYLDALTELGTGIVYGDDLFQGERLPTQWAMTNDIVRALGRMVPADVEHLYCDNAILTLGREAGCIRYLPDVVIEHLHPITGKAPTDAGYQRVNSPDQHTRDGAAFRRWVADGLAHDAARVRELRAVSVDGR